MTSIQVPIPENPFPQFREIRCSFCGGPRTVLNGPWLRYLRITQGGTLRGLAARVGISASYLSDLERNRREASTGVTAAILSIFGSVRMSP